MPTVNDEFNRTCVRLDLDPERSGIFTHDEVTLQFGEDDLRAFNECAARIAPGTPALGAEQFAAAARRLARAVGAGNESRFIQIRMRRAGEVRAVLMEAAWKIDPAVVGRMQDLIGYLDGAVALVPLDILSIGGLDRALLVDMAMEGLRAELDSADALFNQRLSAQQLAPPTVAFSNFKWPAGDPQSFGVSPQNLYNPFGTPVFLVYTRWPDSEPRFFEQSVDTTHLHFGFDGSFHLWGRDWDWNADATQTQALQSEFAGPYADNAKLQLAVGPSFLDAQGVDVIAGCVPLDLFQGPAGFTQAMLDYLNANVRNHMSARSDSFDLGVTSTLADLPAGPLGFAAGVERRLERGSDEPDVLVASGEANGTGETFGPTTGAYAVNEAYAELDLPLLKDLPFARQLGVDLATRYSDYSSFGGTDNSKLGLRWKPTDDLLVRSTWSQGFRAPSIFEAFGGTIEGAAAGGVTDICAADPGGNYTPPPALAASCVAHGVPAYLQDIFETLTATGSNPALLPETSRSLTAGLVYSPRWFPGLDLSGDWYRIEIRNAIGNPGAQYFVDACYEQNDPAACSHLTRDADGNLQHVTAINEGVRAMPSSSNGSCDSTPCMPVKDDLLQVSRGKRHETQRNHNRHRSRRCRRYRIRRGSGQGHAGNQRAGRGNFRMHPAE